MTTAERVFLDTGLFIGALLRDDPRHAATALLAGVRRVYTYDPDDWRVFAPEGLVIAGPPSVLVAGS